MSAPLQVLVPRIAPRRRVAVATGRVVLVITEGGGEHTLPAFDAGAAQRVADRLNEHFRMVERAGETW